MVKLALTFSFAEWRTCSGSRVWTACRVPLYNNGPECIRFTDGEEWWCLVILVPSGDVDGDEFVCCGRFGDLNVKRRLAQTRVATSKNGLTG
jgi:hypothetical protein